MAQVKRLIVNADDFGRSSSINQAVIRAHKEGILTTASLMVNGDAAAEAIDLARQNPHLGVGLHLALVCGKSALPHSQIPLLVDKQNNFTDNPVAAGMQYFFQTAARYHLQQEIAAQFEKFAQTGLPLDHVNGHLHFHLHPTVFQILCPLLKQWNVKAARLTYDPLETNFHISSGKLAYRLSHSIIFSSLSERARPIFQQLGIAHTDQVFGLLQDGRVDSQFILKLIPRLPRGASELYSHPSLDQFKHEFEALIDPAVIRAVREAGIELIRYQDLWRN